MYKSLVSILANEKYTDAIREFSDFMNSEQYFNITTRELHIFFSDNGYISSTLIDGNMFRYSVMGIESEEKFINRYDAEYAMFDKMFSAYQHKLEYMQKESKMTERWDDYGY